jgi:hypothetical protein
MYQTTQAHHNQDYNSSQHYDYTSHKQDYDYQNQAYHQEMQQEIAPSKHDRQQTAYPITPQYKSILQHDQADRSTFICNY